MLAVQNHRHAHGMRARALDERMVDGVAKVAPVPTGATSLSTVFSRAAPCNSSRMPAARRERRACRISAADKPRNVTRQSADGRQWV